MSFARGTGLALNVLAFALSFSLAVEGTHLLNLWINTVPAPRTSIPEIAFCREGTDYYLPRRELIPRPSEKSIQRGPKQNMPNLSTLYMVPARIGLCPREFDTLNECLSRNPRMLVLVDPLDGLTPQSRQRVVDYVERGGKVLLIAMGNSPRSRLNEILEDYSMAISDEHVKSKALLQRDRKQPSSESVFHGEAIFHPVTGGKPLVGDADHSCLSYATKGEGTLVCFTLGDYLVDERLGGSSSIPNEAQLRLLVLSYWLFEQLFQSSPQNWSDIPTLKEYFGEDYLRATMPPK